MKNEVIKYMGYEIEVAHDFAKLFEHFGTKATTSYDVASIGKELVKAFINFYLSDIRYLYGTDKVATSNWTIYTANSFYKAAHLYRLKADFEVENRHDGVLRDLGGKVYLCAEWEFNAKSVLGKLGELQKLYNTAVKHQCEAFLFTYMVNVDYQDFAEQVYTVWNSLLEEGQDVDLYFSCALMRQREHEKIREVYGIRTLVFGKGIVEFWDDEL